MATIGVDLGGTKLLAGVVDGSGRVLARERRVVAGLSLDDLVEVTVEAIGALGAPEAMVGLGIPALIDRASGLAVRCVHLPLDDVPFGRLLAVRLGVPVVVDNDANCAMQAEWRAGAAAGCSHAALLTLGTGIGGGLVLDGRLYRGAVGAAAELGHVPVDLDGPPCFGGCPGRGCLEALCSGSALARDAAAAGLAAATGERVLALAREGDPVAAQLLATLGTHLGAGIAGICMALNPEVVVVGGGVMAAGELILAPARAELERRAMEPARSARVAAAAFGAEAGMIGAAFLAAAEEAR